MAVLREDLEVMPMCSSLTPVLVNGLLCGGTRDADALITRFKLYRRHYALPIDASIYLSPEAVHVWSDAEACYRPVFCTDKLHLLPGLISLYKDYLHLLWPRLLIEGVVGLNSGLLIAMARGTINKNRNSKPRKPRKPYTSDTQTERDTRTHTLHISE